MHWPIGLPQSLEQRTAFDGIVGLARRQRESYRGARVRGDEMDLRVPSTTGLADSLRTVFFEPPFRPDAP